MSSNSNKFFSFRTGASKLFGDSIEQVSFKQPEARREQINAWVEKITQHHIKNLIPDGFITNQTVSVFANAAFLRGRWVISFNDRTYMSTFDDGKNSTVEMMHITAEFDYGSSKRRIHQNLFIFTKWINFICVSGVLTKEEATFLEMPYKTNDGNTISMFAFLPLKNSPAAVDNLLKKMSTSTIEAIGHEASKTVVDVKFPKIELKKEYKLMQVSYSQC